MLLRLIVRDFVIVDRIELEFGGGFGALTGETGAGKSILVDALSLALGERADATVVRSGAERAEISAEFDVAPGSALESWLRAGDFDTDACLLRRVIDSAGRSRAYINGAAATLGQLREVADFLADIHGQNAHHSLLRADAQRELARYACRGADAGAGGGGSLDGMARGARSPRRGRKGCRGRGARTRAARVAGRGAGRPRF
jgi:DNA repair protein RecN (Recombination protein N)